MLCLDQSISENDQKTFVLLQKTFHGLMLLLTQENINANTLVLNDMLMNGIKLVKKLRVHHFLEQSL